jgi:hypothetical protein
MRLPVKKKEQVKFQYLGGRYITDLRNLDNVQDERKDMPLMVEMDGPCNESMMVS